ncbi:MAG: hypothetical protein B0D92_07405 [Spirochaeta sp. LUC14_002_19_P3]|nr:MAG: hypothetical protein B0D92_07405 [Spirochaeta sp. LUC14_002_19_P3]
MNMVLLEEEELEAQLPHDDPRIKHITGILGLSEGGCFLAGIVGGAKGEAVLHRESSRGWRIQFTPKEPSPPLLPVTIIIGAPRPPVAKRLLRDLTAMGVREMRFCAAELSEKSYLSAKLWREGQWLIALKNGAMQGGSTFLPRVRTMNSLREALSGLPENAARIGFDMTGEKSSRGEKDWAEMGLALGPERGWTDSERRVLRENGFTIRSLGERILRTETACAAALGLLLGERGIY